jgi:RHS repeat-associated protein
MGKIFIKTVSCFVLFFFCAGSLLAPGCFAESSCWNDGSIDDATGGKTGATGQPANEVNKKGNTKAADPVDVSNGNYYYEIRDLFIPSRDLPLEITRNYNSLEVYEGPFGIGWSHSYNIFVLSVSDGSDIYVVRRNADGSKDKFLQNPDGSYAAPEGCYDTLTKDAAGYTVLDKHGFKYRFDLSGKLKIISDRNLNQITFKYDPATGVLLKAIDSLNRAIEFGYNANRKITSIKDFAGRTTVYDYDTAGNLAHVTTPATGDYPSGLTTTYAYDANHRVTSITDAKNQTYVSLKYDDNGRAYEVNYGGVYHFDYQVNLTILTDPKGFRTDYALNPNGTVNARKQYSRYVRLHDPSYYETKYTYDAKRELVKIVYPRGNWVKYTYDSKGNILEVRQKKINAADTDDPVNDIVTRYTYESRFNFIKTAIDPKGKVTSYTYDYETGPPQYWPGNLLRITYPTAGGTTPRVDFSYNAYGQVEMVTDPNGVMTKYVYYPETGYLKQIINDFGSGKLNITREFEYDNVGNVTVIKDGLGHAAMFQYNALNQVVRAISPVPFNYITRYSYDETNNLKRVERQADDNGSNWQTTSYTYNIVDRVESITDSLNNVMTYDYDANYNLTSVLDAEGNLTTYDYDERDLLWKVTDAISSVTEYAYDENENSKEIKDANGNLTTYAYDDFDRLFKTAYADGSSEEYDYDANSNITSHYDQRYNVIRYSYDNLGRVITKSSPESVIQYQYDAGSRLKVVTDAAGAISYTYDNVNRVTAVSFPGGKSLSYEYDADSNRTKLAYPDLTYITYEYDQLNRLKTIKDQSAQTVASYTYDALSRRTGLSYANNTSVAYTYDAINRLRQLANRQTGQPAVLSQYDYTYDKVGNRLSLTSLRAPEGGEAISTYAYDKIYQLKSVDYPPMFTFADTSYTYDDVGNRVSSSGSDIVTYTTNNLNQYTNVGPASYSYDATGNLTSSATNTYTYDSENRLIRAVIASPQGEAIYTYDAFGRRVGKAVNGVATTFLYDGDQIIAEYDGTGVIQAKYVYGTGIDEPIKMERGGQSYYYHYDGLGSVTNLTDSTGSTAESYSYDAFGNTSGVSSVGNTRLFTGREYDSETGSYSYRARQYSPGIGRFNQTDPLGIADNTNLYTYVGNNPVNRVDPYGLISIAPTNVTGTGAGGWEPTRPPVNPPIPPPIGPITPPTPGGGITNHTAQPGDIVYEDDDWIVTLIDKIQIGKDGYGRPIYRYIFKIYNKKTGETKIITKIRIGDETPPWGEDGEEGPPNDGGEGKCKK